MNPIEQFENEKTERIKSYSSNEKFKELSKQWTVDSFRNKYVYNFNWLGRPIIQYPQDIMAMQEIIFEVKPDLIIETGIAHGGSLILSASILEVIGHGEDLGIDIDIRKHNREKIETHLLSKRIKMLEGSSISTETKEYVSNFAKDKQKVVVFLDSHHTHEHVLEELNFYSKFVSKDSYIVTFDSFVEILPDDCSADRSWGKGNNPQTAVYEFLSQNENFEIDLEIENKLMITCAPKGYLKRVL